MATMSLPRCIKDAATKSHTLLTAKAQVCFVLFRYRWQAKRYTWYSHPFTVTYFTTVLNGSNDVIPFDSIDVKCYKTISQEGFYPQRTRRLQDLCGLRS